MFRIIRGLQIDTGKRKMRTAAKFSGPVRTGKSAVYPSIFHVGGKLASCKSGAGLEEASKQQCSFKATLKVKTKLSWTRGGATRLRDSG